MSPNAEAAQDDTTRVMESTSIADSGSLSRRTLDAFAWRMLSESSKLLLQLTVQIILARLLPVEAFGLLAVAMLVINFGSRLSEGGTAPALIQRAAISTMHIRVAFSISVLCGALVSGAIWLGAPILTEGQPTRLAVYPVEAGS